MENKITHFNRQIIGLLDKEIQNALSAIKEKYRLAELKMGNISFGQNSFSAKVEAALPAYKEIQELYTLEEVRFFAHLNGLPENLLNQTFISNGKMHKIIRIEIRNPKFPIITECSNDGKHYKFATLFVKEILERTPSGQSEIHPIIKVIHNTAK